MLLLQEFYLEVRDRRGYENQVPDHLSRFGGQRKRWSWVRHKWIHKWIIPQWVGVHEKSFSYSLVRWFVKLCDMWANARRPKLLSAKRFLFDVKRYFWMSLFCHRICISHYLVVGVWATSKILQSGYCWPNLYKYAYEFVNKCIHCKKQGWVSKSHVLTIRPILEVGLFDVWEIDIMGVFVNSFGNKYMFVHVDYISKWVEVMELDWIMQ